ncbi:MAG: hypothetical protein ACRETM_08755, partial [Stenotrophobium sp.]
MIPFVALLGAGTGTLDDANGFNRMVLVHGTGPMCQIGHVGNWCCVTRCPHLQHPHAVHVDSRTAPMIPTDIGSGVPIKCPASQLA